MSAFNTASLFLGFFTPRTQQVFLLFFIGLFGNLSAQDEFNIQSFPYTDVHMHACIKPFNSRHVSNYSIWEQIDHNCEGNMSNLFLNGSKEVPRSSQCHLEGLVKGNVRIAYLSLTPLEKGMMDAKLLNEQKKGLQTMACVSGVESKKAVLKEETINYYDDLVDNLKFVEDGEYSPYYIEGKSYTYEVIRSGQHLKKVLADPLKIAIILNIEGGHTLGHSLEPDDISHTLAYQNFYLDNVERLKGLKPIKSGSLEVLEYPFLSMNINHFFWNGLGGHARTFGAAQTFIFGGKKGVGEGLTDFGKKVIKRMLDKSEGRRILVDIKHMSLESRNWYFDYLRELREKGDTVGIISSHSTVAGISKNSKAYQENDNKSKNKNSYLNLWRISLCDEDVQEIHASKGVIGIMLDKYRLIGELGKKAIEETVAGSAQRRKLYAKILWANIFECIEAVGKPSAWDIIAIGSDFDGMIVPFETYPRSNEMPDMAQDLLDFLKNPEDIFDLFSKEDIQRLMFDLEPEDILKKIMYENGLNFAIRNLDNALPSKVGTDK